MCSPPQATSAAAVPHPLPAAPAAAGPPAASAPTPGPAAGTTAAAAGPVTGVTAGGPLPPSDVAAATSGRHFAAAAAAGPPATPALSPGLGLVAGTTAATAGPVSGVTASPPASSASSAATAPVAGVTAGLSADPQPSPSPVPSAAQPPPAAPHQPPAVVPAAGKEGVGPAVPRTTTIEVVRDTGVSLAPVLTERELVRKGQPPRDILWLPTRVGQDPRAPPQPLPSSKSPVCFLLLPGFVPVPDKPASHLYRPHKPEKQKRPRSPSPERSSTDPLGLLEPQQPTGSKATQSRNARRKKNRAAYAAKAKAEGKVNRQTLKNLNRSSLQFQKRAKEHWDAAQAAAQRKFDDEARRSFTLANQSLSKAFRTLHLLAKLGDSLPVSAAILRRTVFNAEELIAFPV